MTSYLESNKLTLKSIFASELNQLFIAFISFEFTVGIATILTMVKLKNQD
jgi:hypothetical protein